MMDEKVKKIELYRILKNLYYLAEKEDKESFNHLNNIYNNLMKDIFGYPWNDGTESFNWDVARNGVMVIFSLKPYYGGQDYEKRKKEQLTKASKKIEELESYLI